MIDDSSDSCDDADGDDIEYPLSEESGDCNENEKYVLLYTVLYLTQLCNAGFDGDDIEYPLSEESGNCSESEKYVLLYIVLYLTELFSAGFDSGVKPFIHGKKTFTIPEIVDVITDTSHENRICSKVSIGTDKNVTFLIDTRSHLRIFEQMTLMFGTIMELGIAVVHVVNTS